MRRSSADCRSCARLSRRRADPRPIGLGRHSREQSLDRRMRPDDLPDSPDSTLPSIACSAKEEPAVSSGFLQADDGTRTHDLLHGKRVVENRVAERKTALSPARWGALGSPTSPGASGRFGHKNLTCAQRCGVQRPVSRDPRVAGSLSRMIRTPELPHARAEAQAARR
jgi:hypothetical protein